MYHATSEIFKLLNPPILLEGSGSIFPVKVYDKGGVLKKEVGKEELHKRHWKNFEDGEVGLYSRLKGRRTKPVSIIESEEVEE